MRCDHVQRELGAIAGGKLGHWNAWRITRHLARCHACAVARERMQRLEEQAGQWRSDAPPAALQARIAAALSDGGFIGQSRIRDPQSAIGAPALSPLQVSLMRLKENRTMTRRFALALTVAAVGGALVMSMERNTASAELLRMQAAAKQARSVHAVYSVAGPGGTLRPERRIWYQNGNWRLEDTRRPVLISTGGKLWTYDPQAGKAVEAPGDYPPVPPELERWAASGFLSEELMRDMGRSQWRGKIRRMGTTTVEGRTVRQILIEDADDAPEPTRLLFRIDDRTDLPLRVEKQHEVAGLWINRVVVTFQFNQALPARLFDPGSLSGAGR